MSRDRTFKRKENWLCQTDEALTHSSATSSLCTLRGLLNLSEPQVFHLPKSECLSFTLTLRIKQALVLPNHFEIESHSFVDSYPFSELHICFLDKSNSRLFVWDKLRRNR